MNTRRNLFKLIAGAACAAAMELTGIRPVVGVVVPAVPSSEMVFETGGVRYLFPLPEEIKPIFDQFLKGLADYHDKTLTAA